MPPRGAPDAECDVALAAFGERGREDRQRRRRDDRRTEPLQRARGDQRRFRPREARHQRSHREENDACEEDAPTPEQIGRPPPEEQKATEHERVRADYPLQVLLREPQVDLNRRQRHIHDCNVQDDHELHDAQKRQCQPFASIRSHHGVRFPFTRGDETCSTFRLTAAAELAKGISRSIGRAGNRTPKGHRDAPPESGGASQPTYAKRSTGRAVRFAALAAKPGRARRISASTSSMK